MKKRFNARARGGGDVSLNITAMADIFTVILVFLLMGFSSGAMNISPSKGVNLPMAGALDSGYIEALKIEISQSGIQVEAQPAVTLADYRVPASEMQADGSAKSLVDVLKTSRARQIEIAKLNPDLKLDARVIVLADEKTPYSTIKAVLAAAAVQGFTDFKLAVVNSAK